MEGTYGRHGYFPSEPVIQPVRTGESTTSTRSSPPHRSQRRPPTPPFPNPTSSPLQDSGYFNCKDGSRGERESTVRPSRLKGDHPAYARFISQYHDEDPATKPRSRSRSSSDAGTLSAVLRLLAHETARADAAESELRRDTQALLSRMKDVKEASEKSAAELACTRGELELYKFQLDLAQKEIKRAQVIVDQVELARAEAEDRGERDRDKMRKMMTQRALEIAREEGRREGWKQGLERGRWVAWSSIEAERRAEEDEGEEEDSQRTLSSSPVAQSPPRTTRENVRSARGRGGDGATIAAPVPVHPPSSQSQRSGPSSAPESIAIQADAQRSSRARTQSPGQSRRSGARSPSLAPSRRSHRSHRSVVLPPDGYIPTLGPDALISLPPPHELSQPVEFSIPATESNSTIQSVPRDEPVNTKGKNKERPPKERGDQRIPRVRDYAYGYTSAAEREPITEYDDLFRSRRREERYTPAASTVSRGSTRISQYDLVSPPKVRDVDRDRDRQSRRRRAEGQEREGLSPRTERTDDRDFRSGVEKPERTQPEQIVEEWRSANSDVIGTPTPTNSRSIYRQRAASAAGGSIYSMSGVNAAPAEVPIANPTIPSSPRLRSPRVSGGPREPREVTLPMPASSAPLGGYGRHIYEDRDARDARGENQQPWSGQSTVPTKPSIYHQGPPSGLTPESQSSGFPWTRKTFERSASSATVPGILVEPPSHSPTNSSEGTIVDPVLLTPEHANRPTALPDGYSTSNHHVEYSSYTPHSQDPAIVLPTNMLPPGFVPLSPIPSITNFNPADHDHHRMHEQYQGSGYQIYAGMTHVPEPTQHRFGAENSAPSGSGSALFGEPPRPATAAGGLANTTTAENSRRRVMSFGASPAPLNRPFSIFSDSD